MIARRKEFRADKASVDRFLSYPNAVVKAPYELVSSFGSQSLEGITIRNKETQEEEELSVSGLFLYVGEIPQNGFLSVSGLETADGFVKTEEDMRTNIPGLYAAGDLRNKKLRQIVTAASDGAIAATSIHDDFMRNR